MRDVGRWWIGDEGARGEPFAEDVGRNPNSYLRHVRVAFVAGAVRGPDAPGAVRLDFTALFLGCRVRRRPAGDHRRSW